MLGTSLGGALAIENRCRSTSCLGVSPVSEQNPKILLLLAGAPGPHPAPQWQKDMHPAPPNSSHGPFQHFRKPRHQTRPLAVEPHTNTRRRDPFDGLIGRTVPHREINNTARQKRNKEGKRLVAHIHALYNAGEEFICHLSWRCILNGAAQCFL